MGPLYIFDFDDTLAMTDSHVRVMRIDGTTDRLDSRQFAEYRAADGDELDFSEFTEASGTLIQNTVDEMEAAISRYGIENVYIVTARSIRSPVYDFLDSLGITSPEVVATAGSAGKATWLTRKLETDTYSSVFVYEDCRKNITMLKDIVEAYNEELGKDVKYSAICILPSGKQEIVDSLIRNYVNLLFEKKTQDKRLQAFTNKITRTIMATFSGKSPSNVSAITQDDLLVDPDLVGSDIYEFYAGDFPLAIDPDTIDEDFYDEDIGQQVIVTVEIDKNSTRDEEDFVFNVSASDKPTTGMSNFGIHVSIEAIPGIPEQIYGQIRDEVANSVRHELEHVSQGPDVGQYGGAYNRGEGYWNFKSGPEDVTTGMAKYLLKPEEIPAHVRGYLQNAKSLEQLESGFKGLLDGYLDKGIIEEPELEIILDTWLTWVEENINRKKFQKNK